MSAAPWNPLAAETGIVAQVQAIAQAPGTAWARLVGTRKHLADVAEEMQVTPAVYVVYDGFAVLPSSDEFTLQLSHRWLVVLALGHAASQREAAQLNQAAGPYMGQLLIGLNGHQVPGCPERLVAATPPRPYYSPARFAYFPLLFTHGSTHCNP
ncbi:hypothetical protein [Paracidovorax wautersii]|uniref:phage tail terminator protein n=1 Tax=Paracidovorax wautersii TaxID=1177982 RepID=UPI0031CEEB33